MTYRSAMAATFVVAAVAMVLIVISGVGRGFREQSPSTVPVPASAVVSSS